MDEVVKRRIAGAIALVAVAFGLATLLPRPGAPPRDPSVQRVTIDLTAHPAPPPAAVPDSVLPGTVQAPPRAPEAPGAESGLPDEVADATAEPGGEEQGASTVATAAPSEKQPEASTPPPVAETPKPASARLAESVATRPAAPAPPPDAPASRPGLKLAPTLASRPTQSASATPVPPATATTAKAAWMIQVGSYAEITNARVAQDKLKAGGFTSIISPLDTAKGTLYRVRAGPFGSRDQASASRPAVIALGFAQAGVVEK